jgi:uncharacterized protein (TIGR02246 family)
MTRHSRARHAQAVARLFGVCLALSVGTSSVTAQDDAQRAVLQAEQRWTQALVKGDVAALRELYADDLVYVHSAGNRESKTQFIRRVETGGLKYESVDLIDPKVRMYGDAAVVNGAFDVRVMSDGAPLSTRVMYIHVYARRGAKWQIVAHQTTRVPAQ